MNKLLVVVGPTATGKTAIAASIAKLIRGELISADSRQVYRGMDITTGKDRPDVPIFLYDVVNPDEAFSVSHWVLLATQKIRELHARQIVPIVVGGTGLYIKALLEPLPLVRVPPDPALRSKNYTVKMLQHMVSRGAMNDSDWNNPRRLLRKIEIEKYIQSHPEINTEIKDAYDVLIIGLTAPLAVLDARIDERMKQRKSAGLDEEIARLTERYPKDLPSMSAIGLQEHAYARRQLTWFKKQKGINWYDISKPGWQQQIVQRVQAWYTTT